jgi:hypothetical protein
MPLAPRDALAPETPGGDTGRRPRVDGAEAADSADSELEDDRSTLAQLNRGRAEEQPDSEAGRQHRLASLDWQTGSTLLFRGGTALQQLHEFLINSRPGPAPHFLSLQLLAPQPFTNGAPSVARVVYNRAEDANAGRGGARGGGVDIIRLEEPDRAAPALLLPSVVRKLTALLQRVQRDGFELAAQPDSSGPLSEAFNVSPEDLYILPDAIGARGVVTQFQPRAKLWQPDPEREAEVLADAQAAQRSSAARQAESKPRCLAQVHYRDGQLRVGFGNGR